MQEYAKQLLLPECYLVLRSIWQGKTIQQTIILLKKLCQETLKNVLSGGKDVT